MRSRAGMHAKLLLLLTEMCCAPEPDEGKDLLGQIGGAIKVSIFCFVMVNKKMLHSSALRVQKSALHWS